jgi:nitrate reductase gamma subunit
MVLIVTNKMDMVVYTTLFVQIVSGLAVAYFDRWGSSWFASTLTPYLVSLFAFNPDVAAVSAMSWLVQVHIFSAFFIIAIIPFTRFMHFLVAPIDYMWRDYQLVIWNWSRKSIRNSTAYFFGKKPDNQ